MQKYEVDLQKLQSLVFNRSQIVSLIDDTEIWGQIPLEERFAFVESNEFVALMGTSFTEHTRKMLENELLAKCSTLH